MSIEEKLHHMQEMQIETILAAPRMAWIGPYPFEPEPVGNCAADECGEDEPPTLVVDPECLESLIAEDWDRINRQPHLIRYEPIGNGAMSWPMWRVYIPLWSRP